MGGGRELPARRGDGSEILVEVALQPITLAEGTFVVAYCLDVAARRVANDRLRRLALTDRLTGLANEASFRDRLDQEIAAAGTNLSFGLLYIDIDKFKSINDNHGHAGGDAVLSTIGRRLAGAVRGADLAARLHGDEFAVLVGAPVGLAEVMAAAGRIASALSAPISLANTTIDSGASIGVTLGGANASGDATVLLAEADGALFDAKHAGGGIALAKRLGTRDSTHDRRARHSDRRA
jgi:diguanylate cyclase (GGDEF)-like protein